MENREDIIAEVATAALDELEKMEQGRIQAGSPQEMLKQIFRGMIDPQPAEDNSPGFPPIPQVEDEFPKLLVDYDKREFAIVENWQDWAPIHHLWVRPLAELAALKEAGFTERPKTDWERRKQQAAAR